MSNQEYLSIFGAILFGLSASFYLISWGRLIQANRLLAEWRFSLWAFAYFMVTVTQWYVDYEVISNMQGFGGYFLGFVSIGLLFIISSLINPDRNTTVGWAKLRNKTDEVVIISTLYVLWDFAYAVLYLKLPAFGIGLYTPVVVVIITVAYLVKRKAWLLWVYLVAVYTILAFLIYDIW